MLRRLPSADTVLKIAAMIQTIFSMVLTIVAWYAPFCFLTSSLI